MTVYRSDLEKLEKFWAEADSEKKAELERRREEELRRWQEEQKRKEEHLERLAEELHSETSSSSDSGKISNEEWWDAVDMTEHMKQEYGEDYFKDL